MLAGTANQILQRRLTSSERGALSTLSGSSGTMVRTELLSVIINLDGWRQTEWVLKILVLGNSNC
jgi:hypothetical protein